MIGSHTWDVELLLARVMDNDGMNMGGYWWAWLIGLLIVAALIGVLAWAILRTTWAASTPSAPAIPPSQSAEEVLAQRLARGEIDPDEYRQRLEALRGT